MWPKPLTHDPDRSPVFCDALHQAGGHVDHHAEGVGTPDDVRGLVENEVAHALVADVTGCLGGAIQLAITATTALTTERIRPNPP